MSTSNSGNLLQEKFRGEGKFRKPTSTRCDGLRIHNKNLENVLIPISHRLIPKN